jgi:hypothetical protein
MMERMRSSASEISVLIDPQFILIQDFIETLQHAHTLQSSWLLVATAKIVHEFPFELDMPGSFWTSKGGEAVEDKLVGEMR